MINPHSARTKHLRRFRTGLIILIVLAVSLLTVVGYVFIQRMTQPTKTDASFRAAAQVVAKQKSAVETMVESAYAMYATNTDRQTARKEFIQHTTPELALTLENGDNSYDPVLCSENGAGKLTYGSARLIGATGMTVIIPVTNTFEQEAFVIQVRVDADTNKISAIECPTQ